MEWWRTFLDDASVRGAVRCADGSIRLFRRRGVADLFEMVQDDSDWLSGAVLCDRVVGRGAAWLMVKGGVKEVFAVVISRSALDVLARFGIAVSYEQLEPNIINHDGTDVCPVEKLTAPAKTADEAFQLIRQFMDNNKQ